MRLVNSKAQDDLSEIMSIVGFDLSSLSPVIGNNSVCIVIDGHFCGAIAASLLSEPVRAALVGSDRQRFVNSERSGLILAGSKVDRHLSLSELRSLNAEPV